MLNRGLVARHDCARRSPSDGTTDTWRQRLQLLLVVVVAIALRWGVMEPRWIPLNPCSQGCNRKIDLGLEAGAPLLGLTALNRNAVVVFRTPEVLAAAGYDPNAALIKRVVGVPVMQFRWRAAPCSATAYPSASSGSPKRWTINCRRRRWSRGNCWFLGDNRNASLDSHLWGQLNEADVVGTARWRYWPLADFGPIKAPAMG